MVAGPVAGPSPQGTRARPLPLWPDNARRLVEVELVHEAVSTAKARWLASLVRWTQSGTSLGSVLKFAGWQAYWNWLLDPDAG